MFDVFYIGKKPGLFPHERSADSIQHACEQSRTRYCWIVNYLADYSAWDWLWEPVPWQSHQRHAWASQWQKDSGTYLVPKTGYTETNYHCEQINMLADMSRWGNTDSVTHFDFSWHPDYTDPPFNYEFGTQWQKTGGPRYPVLGATEIKYVSQSGSTARAQTDTVYIIDHMDNNIDIVFSEVQGQIANKNTVRYFDNYLDTLKRIARNAHSTQQEFVWICSSVCDYSNFDFSWHPEAWQNHMLHVFPSSGEKFGDTFFMHVPTFVSKINDFELLEWYDLNFVSAIDVPRRPIPVIQHSADSHVDAVKTSTWAGPLATFTTTDYVPGNMVTVPLWRTETKTIVSLSKGATSVVVPRVAVPHIKTQLYDYPHIDKTKRMLKDHPLDIVFISNGEPYARSNYDHLKWAVQMEGLDCNHIHHSAGVNGRVAAYQAAARLSTTPWFFAVFAKLEVDPKFDWTWQPDRMQRPKHYIFHAHNPVNGLVYGHQAMIAYNRQLVLANNGEGLDFTLDDEHEVVPIISGTANYTESPWMAWRTAFREVLKLKHSLPDVENEYRLRMWLSDAGEVRNAEWSRFGAEDAVEYYNEVGGDFAALKKSYEWAWLASYAFMRRNLTPDQ
jgi:hypothetical protein